MKRYFAVTLALILSIFFAAAVISCVVESSDDDKESAPSIDTTRNNTYTISFPKINGMEYANVIRESCSYENFSSGVTTRNIGQVVPRDTGSLPATFIFYDAYTNQGYYYRYYIRYYDGSEYTVTSKTDSHNGLGDSESELSADSGVTLTLDMNANTKNYTLTLNNDVTIPDGFEELDVVLYSSEHTIARPFTFATPDETAETTDESSYVIPAETSVDMQKLLSSEFLDTELTLQGLIAIVSNADSTTTDGTYDYYYWTSLYEVTLNIVDKDSSGNENNKSFTIPSSTNADNRFDFSASIADSRVLSVN